MTDGPRAHAPVAERVRARLEALRAPLHQRIDEAPAEGVEAIGLELGRTYAAGLDALLLELYPATAVLSRSAGNPARHAGALELAGVGGYGRGAVALGADLDVRLLAPERSAEAQAAAEALLYPLWDSGLSVGHQVVTIDELIAAARDDLPTATSLLDWRHVAGDATLGAELEARASAGLFSPSELGALLERLEREVTQRHGRFGGSVYLLEPDVKNGPGGLRDLDVAGWAARARWGVHAVDELVRVGVLVTRQLEAVRQARELLWRIRNLLHRLAGRRSDRLAFDAQEALAPRLGYAGGAREAVEQLMSDYYRAARTLSRFRDMIVARAEPRVPRRRPLCIELGDGLQVFDGELTLAKSEILQEAPATALRAVRAAVEHRVPLRPSTRSAIVGVCGDAEWCERLRAVPEAASLFVALVTECAETRLKRGSVLRELHDLGLLLAMIPEFGPVVGRVHHDTYHVYTVDVHSVAAVDRLVEIVRGEVVSDEDEAQRWAGSLACRLAAEITRPHVLFFATLLHDIGKAIGRRDHSQRGAELAPVILGRLGFERQDIADVARLIEQHLTMYLTATRRDLDDPGTVSELALLIGSREALRKLYLLTVADLSTTSPTSMTSWKARMLDELFIAADQHLRGAPEDAAWLARRRDDVLRALEGLALAPALATFARAFLAAMPERYAIGNPAEAIAAHAEACFRHLQARGHGEIALVPSRRPEAAEICVVADDRPGLLAHITAALAGSRLGVHAAQIYSVELPRPAGGTVRLAVDLFWVQRGDDGHEGIEQALPRLARELAQVSSGERTPHEVARIRPRRTSGPAVQTRVVCDNRASPRHTVLEVITRDRAGLLFVLADAIFQLGLSIAAAKIVTEGTRVADVFYVSARDGKKVSLEERGPTLRQALLEAIERMDKQEHSDARAFETRP